MMRISSVCGRCSVCELYVKGFCLGALEWRIWDCPQYNPTSNDRNIVKVIRKIAKDKGGKK